MPYGIIRFHHGTLVVEAVIPLVLRTRGITMLLPLVCRDETIYYITAVIIFTVYQCDYFTNQYSCRLPIISQ